MKMQKKMILVMDFLLIAGTLAVLFFALQYARPLVIASFDGFGYTRADVLFSFEDADVILIDETNDFSSPDRIVVGNDVIITLQPGDYYWKIRGLSTSEIKDVSVTSEVRLKLKNIGGERYDVVNVGNSTLNVDLYDNGKYTGSVIFDVEGSGQEGSNG